MFSDAAFVNFKGVHSWIKRGVYFLKEARLHFSWRGQYLYMA